MERKLLSGLKLGVTKLILENIYLAKNRNTICLAKGAWELTKGSAEKQEIKKTKTFSKERN